MAVRSIVLYQTWAMRITLATTLIVVVLSWINAVRIPDLIVRSGISFGIMYLLMAGILRLFEITAPQKPQNKRPASSDANRGGVIDFSVGGDGLESQPPTADFPGQVDPGLSTGLTDSEQQAEIVRRMGWK